MQVRLCSVLLVCLVAATLVDAAPDHEHVHKKALLVRKHLRRLKKREGALKLADGKGDHEGNVEIFHMGKWGSVCDDEWDIRDADVVCRQLGFKGAVDATHNSHFGPTRPSRFWMDNLYCSGEEARLDECRFDGWGHSDCSKDEAAGVVCKQHHTTTTEPPTTTSAVRDSPRTRIGDSTKEKMSVRLIGGRVPEEGRVEVKFGDSPWGLVCGDGWGLLEAAVVCHQLGLGYASDAVQTNFFGGNSSHMVLSGVECRGNEPDLTRCLHDRIGQVSCPGSGENIAAVVCSKVMPDLVIDHHEIMRTAHLEDRQLYFLQCAMEENCLATGAYKLQAENGNWHLETRRLLRFTARILNAGTADFRPAVPKHLWEFHQCHMHYHSMEVFATFDILDSKGTKVAEGHKASFCLEDNQCMPGVKPFYFCANFGDQGISVNCSDIYRHNIDCQWVDISELEPGLYTFKVAINSEFKVGEMSFENNEAACKLYYTESFAHVYDCKVQRPGL
ncbi:lysyl oxidase homolog 2 [Anabrus simplex]|uniref:lysyl oxidase homolog 2 n=1 Tax=Anabrus simplex TaxID=316456 RepID=UPI0035A27753